MKQVRLQRRLNAVLQNGFAQKRFDIFPYKLGQFAERRREIVNRYNEAFSQIPQLFVQQEIPESDTTRQPAL